MDDSLHPSPPHPASRILEPTDPALVRALAEHARAAARALAPLALADRNAALTRIADALEAHTAELLAANARDLDQALLDTGDLTPSNYARLPLSAAKLAEMAAQVRAVQLLPDPLGRTLDALELDHGLHLQKRTVPLGVLAVIFEARPDAVTQIAALALKSGNAVLLKPGREGEHTAHALVHLIRTAISTAPEPLPTDASSTVTSTQAPTQTAVISTQAPTQTAVTSTQAPTQTAVISTETPTQIGVISTEAHTQTAVTSTQAPTHTGVISTEAKRSGETCGSPATTATLPADAVSLLLGREAIAELLTLSSLVDLVIPRGSRALVEHIQATTRIPVLGHADGICHVYVDQHADLDQALAVVDDSKTDYPAVCNAAETCLVHEAIAARFLPALIARLSAKGVHFRADQPVRDLLNSSIGNFAQNLSPTPHPVLSTEAPALNSVLPATHPAPGPTTDNPQPTTLFPDPDSWHTEYGDLTLALRIVPSLSAAIDHIHQHGSAHTETICTTDPQAAERFLTEVDAASVMLNASTRFADGFRYGLGAEVGVSTSRIHARGPVGLEGLTTTKFVVRGDGHLAADYRGPNARPFTHTRS